jgi:hypothetical protein
MLDSYGNPSPYKARDRVVFLPTGDIMTVVRQVLHYDCGETFWGDLVVVDSDGNEFRVNCWQCSPVQFLD